MKTVIAALLALASVVSAHFKLDYPEARGFDEDKLVQFPCGSFDTPQTNRTLWPISGGQIALTMGHIEANVEVLIGFGNDPGSAFNTVLRPTFQETGLGDFCMTGFSLPDGLNVTEGTNATIQVITNGDPDGGLYNCADITFTSQAVTGGTCQNGTGVTASSATISGSPNGTTSSSPSSTSSGTAAATSTKAPGAASGLKVGMGGLMAAAGVAFAMAL